MCQLITGKDKLFQISQIYQLFNISRQSLADSPLLLLRLKAGGLAVLFILFLNIPLAFAQEDLITGGVTGDTNDEAANDPLTEEMVPDKIKKHLAASRKKLNPLKMMPFVPNGHKPQKCLRCNWNDLKHLVKILQLKSSNIPLTPHHFHCLISIKFVTNTET